MHAQPHEPMLQVISGLPALHSFPKHAHLRFHDSPDGHLFRTVSHHTCAVDVQKQREPEGSLGTPTGQDLIKNLCYPCG